MATTASDIQPMEIDNRYASSAAAARSVESPTATAASTNINNTNNAVVYTPELLQMYYLRLFPFAFVYKWLSYLDASLFKRREFSMTIEPVPGEEIYIRYQSFATETELAAAVRKRRPVKIDIGAVFSSPPKDHKTLQKNSFGPEQRELVFDIDLTDYDEVRHCGCSGAAICPKCWALMTMAVKIMDAGLREDFGFQRVAWFYSGRRGVHAWVCDEGARLLTDEGRSAVASYFEVKLGSDKNKDVYLGNPLHPMLQRAFDALEPMFIEQVLPASGHGLLAEPVQWTMLLQSMPEAAAIVRDKLAKEWSKDHSTLPAEKWVDLKRHLAIFCSAKAGTNKSQKSISSKDISRLENWPCEVVFRHTYPRLDINVSKMRNHLLKSPFCVHPKTGRVCVPFQAAHVDSFDPFTVPTLPQLQKELDENSGVDTVHDWQKTSLKPYFEAFEKEFLEPLTFELRKQQRDAKEQEAALIGDF